jgi:hypothetical protein
MGSKSSCCRPCFSSTEYKDDHMLTSQKSLFSIIKVQALFRGFRYRREKKLSKVTTATFGGSFNNDKRPGIEVSWNTEPTGGINIKVAKLQELLPAFELNEKENFLVKNTYLQKHAILYPDNSLYKGYFNKDWLKEGYGLMYLPDGSIYEGFFKNNNMEGRGRLLNVEGFYYEGDFVDNKANGFGKYVSLDGISFIGYWKNEKQNGFGEELYPDGSKYEGFFENGKKSGKGKFVWNDGPQYEGDFYHNDIHGSGIYRWKDGRIYQGGWLHNKMEGNGVFIWPDNKKYIGSYRNDNKHGYGVFIWPDGKKYEGSWLNGKQHGYGMYSNNGITQYGEWKMGKKARWISSGSEEYITAVDDLKNKRKEYNFSEIEGMMKNI